MPFTTAILIAAVALLFRAICAHTGIDAVVVKELADNYASPEILRFTEINTEHAHSQMSTIRLAREHKATTTNRYETQTTPPGSSFSSLSAPARVTTPQQPLRNPDHASLRRERHIFTKDPFPLLPPSRPYTPRPGNNAAASNRYETQTARAFAWSGREVSELSGCAAFVTRYHTATVVVLEAARRAGLFLASLATAAPGKGPRDKAEAQRLWFSVLDRHEAWMRRRWGVFFFSGLVFSVVTHSFDVVAVFCC